MYVYIGFGRFGFFMPLWLALTIGLPVTIIWLSIMLLVVWPIKWGVAARRMSHNMAAANARRQHEKNMVVAREELVKAMNEKMEKALAEAAPGVQRDELGYWWRQATEAYLRFLFEGHHESDWTTFVKASGQIDALKLIQVGTCPRCKTGGQLVGRQCGVCGQARVAFTPKR